jgi:hypothetical protein
MHYIDCMKKSGTFAVLLALIFSVRAHGQIRQTSVPLGNAVSKALAKNSLTGDGARPFHLRVIVSEPENPQSPYQGTIEEWWSSPTEWRREVTAKSGMHQTIVVADGKKSEKDEGDYFPLWLRNFVTALVDPIPDSSAWTSSKATINQITFPNGQRSDACARMQFKVGTGSRATDAFANLCFDGKDQLESVISPRYSMEFHDYHGFGKKQIARKLSDDPEPGTALSGDVVQLEDLSRTYPNNPFSPLPTNDGRFESTELSSAELESLTAGNTPIAWPPVRSGNLHGFLAMYISADAQDHVREAWPLNSDNAGLEDPARAQVEKWTITPAKDSAGNPVQVDGGLGFSFHTVIGNPIPVLSDAEARQLAIKTVEPKFAPGTAPSGTRYRVSIAINEQGAITGISVGDAEVPGTIKPPDAAFFAIMAAVHEWRFQPLIKDGAPQYFFAVLVFAIP